MTFSIFRCYPCNDQQENEPSKAHKVSLATQINLSPRYWLYEQRLHDVSSRRCVERQTQWLDAERKRQHQQRVWAMRIYQDWLTDVRYCAKVNTEPAIASSLVLIPHSTGVLVSLTENPDTSSSADDRPETAKDCPLVERQWSARRSSLLRTWSSYTVT